MINTEIFGGYVASFREILEEALAWSKEHPDVELAEGMLYHDEGHYLTIFWREEDQPCK